MFIKDKKISSISGPVSFSLLKPKKFIFDELKKEGVHLPIFMLFGDVHHSDDYQCEKCSCNLQDRSCCMPVYSNDFLRLIDSMATKEYPIDFGIEGFSLASKTEYFKEDAKGWGRYYYEKDTKGKGIVPRLRDNLATCYQKDLRGSEVYEKYCPTKNIRWHYMDARFAYENKYNLEVLLSELEELDEKIFKTTYNDKLDLKKDIDEVKAKFGSDEMWKLILDLQIQFAINPEKGIERYFNIGEAFKYSLVLKQFNKLSKSLKDLPFWKKSLADYLVYVSKEKRDRYYKDLKDTDEARIKYYYLLLSYDIDNLFELISSSTFSLVKTASYINNAQNTIFFDLYYIFRTFKIPKEDKNPFLSILYAGDFHSRNIKYFLTNIIKYYEVVVEVNRKGDFLGPDDPELRCSFIPNINFNELALEYGVDVNKPELKPLVEHKHKPKPYVVSRSDVKTNVEPSLKPYEEPKSYVVSRSDIKTYDEPVKPYIEPKPYMSSSRVSKRAPAKKISEKREPQRKTSTRKISLRKAPAKKSSEKREPTRKISVRRSPPKKTSLRRAPSKKTK